MQHAQSLPALSAPDAARGWAGPTTPLGSGPLGIVDAILKSPASVLQSLRRDRGVALRLFAVAFVSLATVGLVIASSSGGVQLFLVPLKLAAGVFFCAVICLPSLYVFSCLAGATQTLKETWGALLMGVALTSLLLLGFAPIVWIFSQATRSVAFMGALHLAFLLLSCMLGLRLVERGLSALNATCVRGLHAWSVLFVLVVFQMTTTLRPLLGEATGFALEERRFFFAYWLSVLAG